MSRPTTSQPVTPAYAYGRFLGQIRDGYAKMLKDIIAGFNAQPQRRLSDEEVEELLMRRWRADIEKQRLQGLAYVREQGRRVRRDLGLPV